MKEETRKVTSSGRKKKGGKDHFLTPPSIWQHLGKFDTDPCVCPRQPWLIGQRYNFTPKENGLGQPFWVGRVWLNPPDDGNMVAWVRKMASHNNGIALLPVRAASDVFFPWVWSHATAILFCRKPLVFLNTAEKPVRWVGPKEAYCLVAYGEENARALALVAKNGKFVRLKGAV